MGFAPTIAKVFWAFITSTAESTNAWSLSPFKPYHSPIAAYACSIGNSRQQYGFECRSTFFGAN